MTKKGSWQDAYGRKAKREGFPARSVYKLEEIDQRIGLLKRGQRVLDLGASPGSWTLYAAQRVAPEGKVLGIDLVPHAQALPHNASIRCFDANTASAEELEGPYDVVLSDMAPSTSGQRGADQYRSFELFMTALRIAEKVLVPGGSLVGKIFQGPDLKQAEQAVRIAFARARILRPKAIRSQSYEVYIAGLEKRSA